MALTPQQQAWLQAWQQHQAQLLAANQQNLLQAQPWNQGAMQGQPWHQPGYSRFANPLFGRAQIPLVGGTSEQESDPQAAMMPYFMGMMGGAQGGGDGGGVNPMLMQMLMSGSTGFQG